MAVIPQIVTSPGAVPSAPTGGLGGGIPRASPQMDIRAPTDPSQAQAAGAATEAQAYESESHSAEKLAKYGEEFADKYVTAKLNVDAANRTADLSAQLHQAEFESSKIADRDQATADFDARAGKIRDDFAAQDVNPRVRAAVDASLPNQIALRRASTQQAAFGLESKDQVAKLIGNIDQYNKQAVDAQDPRLTEQLINQANDAIDGRVAGGWLSAEVAARMKVDFGSNVYRTKIEIAMQKDLASGLALFEATKGKLNAADMRAMAVRAADGGKQLQAETIGNAATPPLATGGGASAGDIGAVRADAEKTLGFSLTITSADRDAAHNAAVGGATGSQHLTPGKALDISLAGLTDEQKTKVYQQFLGDPRVGGIGFYPDHLHVDARGGQRSTWGTPPAAVADQLKTWQASGPAAPTGDALSEARIASLKKRDAIARSDMDPEIKARTLAVIDRNLGTMTATVLEERKATKDAAETEITKTALGKGTDGSFQQFADRYKAAGDFSEAEKWQWFADNESVVKNFYTATPAQQREIAHMAPGAAGVIFKSYLSNQREDRTEFRRLAAEQEQIYNQGIARGDDPETLKHNALQAIAYMKAAGDHGKADSFLAQATGAGEGSLLAKLPPLQREQAEREIRDAANNQNGLSPYYNAVLRQLQQGKSKYDEEWKKDPMGMMDSRGITRTQPLQATMTDEQYNGWVLQRSRDVALTQQHVDPSGQNEVPFLRPDEATMLSQRLLHASPQQRQMELQKMARALSAVPGVLAKVAEQLHKNDIVGANFGNAMALYATGKSEDAAIADSLIVASSAIAEGGPAGDKFKLPEKMITMIDTVLDRSRGSLDSRTGAKSVESQNWAIAARYAYLAQGRLQDQKVIDERTLNAAIKDVYGTIMKGRDGKEWPIPRDVDQSTFKQGINNIQPDDLANLMPAKNGTRATPQMIAEFGTYQPVGDGKYQIFFPDNVKGGGAESVLRNIDGRPLVIDIRQLINRGGQPVRDLPVGQRDPLGQNRGTTEIPVPAAPAAPATPPPAPSGAELIRQNQRRGLPGAQ
jgi:Peptidase M15